MITVDVVGQADLFSKLDRAERNLINRVDAGVAAIAEAILADARQRVLSQRQASGPSALADSLFVAPRDAGLVVGTNAGHAVFVEFGTAQQPARPFLFPAALAARDFTRFQFFSNATR